MNDREMVVAKEYKSLFQDCCFNFEGLKEKTKENYIKLVKDLGAKVSDDAEVIFAPKYYFDRVENNKRKNLFDITYIFDAINHKDTTDLLSYMFVPSARRSRRGPNDELMCYAAQYFYKTDSCHKCYYQKIFCKECCETNEEFQNGIDEECSKSITIIHSSPESEDDKNIIIRRKKNVKRGSNNYSIISSESEENSTNEQQSKRIHKYLNNSAQRLTSSSPKLEENSMNELQSSSTKRKKQKGEGSKHSPKRPILSLSESEENSKKASPPRKKVKNSNSFNSNLGTKISPENGIEHNHRRNNYRGENNSYNEQDGERVTLKEMHPQSNDENSIEDGDVSDDSSFKRHKEPSTSSKLKVTKWINNVKSKVSLQKVINNEPAAESDAESIPDKDNECLDYKSLFFSDREDAYYFDKDNWWLPHNLIGKKLCQIPSCSYEPTIHPLHYPPRKWLSLVEKKIIVKYLITEDAIDKCKGQLIYKKMHEDGYMTHRSWETIRTNFRRTILKEIEKYKIDAVHLEQFIRLREKR